ncbi:MAG: AraC family transcriptional regulator [Lachnospiraceae bacterium]
MTGDAGYAEGYRLDMGEWEENPAVKIYACGWMQPVHTKKIETIRKKGRADCQLLYVAQGSGVFVIGSEKLEVKSGSVVCFLPGERQEYSFYKKDNPIYYWIHISSAAWYQRLAVYGLLDEAVIYVGEAEEIVFYFNKIISELKARQEHTEDSCEALFLSLLISLSRSYHHHQRMEDGDSIPMATIREEIKRNCVSKKKVAEYAKQYNMSYNYFIRRFREAFGITPAQYMQQVKIERAKEYLENSRFSISQISDLLGYDNSLYFSKVFRKSTGMSPSEYRCCKA